MKIAIINLQDKIPLNQKKIQRIAEFVLSGEGCCGKQVSIAVVTDKEIRALNRRFIKKDRATDVLAFSFTARFK